jgi:glycosyltransferase involved in cell wall biosynthesis
MIWIDVEDLFDYARSNPRPSGIQRVAFEIYSVLQARYGASSQVGFVRHDRRRGSFEIITWDQITALFNGLTQATAVQPTGFQFVAGWRQRLLSRPATIALVRRLPPRLSDPLMRFFVLQLNAFRALRELAPRRGSSVTPVRKMEFERSPVEGMRASSFRTLVRPGDILLVLGAPWFDPDYATLIGRTRQLHGVRTALLIYDLIPIRRPEWCHRSLTQQFTAWFHSMVPECGAIFAISRATASDVALYARQQDLVLPGPVKSIPIGTGFTPARTPKTVRTAFTANLPRPGSYVLFVSTIEARKNHALLFRVWRRLLETLAPEAVPTLVFAGRVGWLVADLLQQLENTNCLDGKILIIRDPTDAELSRLYNGCLFTVCPSLFEGWGLPVTESLALGKPCVISDNTSLPEAGGTLARYFDADDIEDAYRVIRATIEDRAGLSAWEARVVAEFRPVPWEATVDAILAGLPHDATAQQCPTPVEST